MLRAAKKVHVSENSMPTLATPTVVFPCLPLGLATVVLSGCKLQVGGVVEGGHQGRRSRTNNTSFPMVHRWVDCTGHLPPTHSPPKPQWAAGWVSAMCGGCSLEGTRV